MNVLQWFEDENRIGLKTDSGEFFYPSAMEIFQSIFNKKRSIRDYSFLTSPSESLLNLSFSRFPAEAALRLYGKGTKIFFDIGIITDIGFVVHSTQFDQAIVAGRWYPVLTDALSSIKYWAENLGALPGVPLTIGTLVALRASAEKPMALIDEITITSEFIASEINTEIISIPGLNATLYPYQLGGIAFLKLIAEQEIGCILGDEMGLGKTLQIIALFLIEKSISNRPSLVVAPATLLENWHRELIKFAPTLTVNMHTGPQRSGIAKNLMGFDVTITSYETVIRDELILMEIPWNILALDEAQNIKNPSAQRTTAVKRLPRRVSVAISGTPFENRLDDIWSLSDFALPGLLGDIEKFRKEFGDGIADATRLAPIISPILLRRKVIEVAKDLPEKIEIPQPIEMSLKLAEGYEDLRLDILARYGPAGGLVATTMLRLYCAHPSLAGPWANDASSEMPKYLRMLEILDEIFSAGEKVLIFSTYQGIADLMMKDLPKRFKNGFFRYIDGRIKVSSRQETVDDFFSHQGFGALFLNPKAAGTGLNITAANHVIHYNPEWNPALTDQASGRAYRRKQERPVTIHHLFFVNTVEEIMIERTNFKRQVAIEAVTGHDGTTSPAEIARALQLSPLSILNGNT